MQHYQYVLVHFERFGRSVVPHELSRSYPGIRLRLCQIFYSVVELPVK